MTELPIMAVGSDTNQLEALKSLFDGQGLPLITFARPREATFYLSQNSVSLLLIDLKETGRSDISHEGTALIERFHQTNADTPIIVITGLGDRLGTELMPKILPGRSNNRPPIPSHVFSLIQNLWTLHSTDAKRSPIGNLNVLTDHDQDPDGLMIATSGVMREIMRRLDQVAQSDASILLTGENGTGKTQMAALLHSRSRRHTHPFVAVNMGAIPETLFESELFGHVRGAFTDAKSDRIGRVELADKGSLFLDEITNTSLAQQAKLLRLLDQKQFERVGASKTQDADLRIIAATNVDIQAMVRENRFRLDLLFRLNTIEIKLPPLRERREDIPLLVRYFLRKLKQKYDKPDLSLSQSAFHAVQDHPWPGNIRELAHVMERAVVMATTTVITTADLMLNNPAPSIPSLNLGANDITHATLEEIEELVVNRRLADLDNDVTRTAFSLGISRSALYRRLQKNRERPVY